MTDRGNDRHDSWIDLCGILRDDHENCGTRGGIFRKNMRDNLWGQLTI